MDGAWNSVVGAVGGGASTSRDPRARPKAVVMEQWGMCSSMNHRDNGGEMRWKSPRGSGTGGGQGGMAAWAKSPVVVNLTAPLNQVPPRVPVSDPRLNLLSDPLPICNSLERSMGGRAAGKNKQTKQTANVFQDPSHCQVDSSGTPEGRGCAFLGHESNPKAKGIPEGDSGGGGWGDRATVYIDEYTSQRLQITLSRRQNGSNFTIWPRLVSHLLLSPRPRGQVHDFCLFLFLRPSESAGTILSLACQIVESQI
ncbi:hypothetical protein F5148DRAFT_1365894 [Russula earlei]|uniref:Uncharacterized protein n=1 Tax=Russula earlei TaxID=71964 RepID=A0ACC0UIZ2_9AGAM|nr:hypothetical protein F5148DRAFT_1365894 [Russula earlei]